MTGASGFIGSNLSRRLRDEGHDVGVIIRPRSHQLRLRDVINKLTVFEGDVVDLDSVQRAMSAFRPSIVYHVAASGVNPQLKDVRVMLDSNVLGSWNVALAAQKVGVHRIVFSGSSFVYEASDTPIVETDTLAPTTMYAASKIAAWFLSRALLTPVSTVNIRIV